MEISNVHSLLSGSNAKQLTIARDQEVGGGGQGTVYCVPGSDQVMKIYSDPAAKAHLLTFVSHVRSQRLNERCTSLKGLPYDVFESSGGDIGILMARVQGQSLTQLGYAPLRRRSLAQRLALAFDVAQGVALLHACGVVVADLAEPNTMVDLADNQAFLIDVEGGGLYRHGGYHLEPLVWGHDQGSLMAFELRDRKQLPTFASDNWSLAGLLHRLLSQPAGADAFFFGKDPRVLATSLPWPPLPESQPQDIRSLLARHRLGLAFLGPRLRYHFQRTFGPLGRHHPEHRTSAWRWSRDLAMAKRWIHQCAHCGQEFVAEQLSHCPSCRTPVPHARLVGGGRTVALQRDGLVVSRYQLGLGKDRRPLLRWRRNEHDLVLEVLGDGCALASPLAYRPLNAKRCYSVPAGTYRLRIQDKGGGSLVLRIIHPHGSWLAENDISKEKGA